MPYFQFIYFGKLRFQSRLRTDFPKHCKDMCDMCGVYLPPGLDMYFIQYHVGLQPGTDPETLVLI